MNLPSHFFADMPAEAEVTGPMIAEACRALRRNRSRNLSGRSTQSLIALLAEVGRRWLQPTNRFRGLALEAGPGHTGFSRETLSAGLDDFFKQLTVENLEALIIQDLGDLRSLDDWVVLGGDSRTGRAARARGHEMLVHVAAGNLPNPTWMHLILGLLTRSAQFVKCASGASFLPRLFAHSLCEEEPKLGGCIELAEWPGGKHHLEEALFAEADCITATGSDETLAALGHRVRAGTRFAGYGHRVSFGYVTHQALNGSEARAIAAKAARDVAAWDQVGCLSPHVIYIESSAEVGIEDFGDLFAAELALIEARQPRGPLSPHLAALIASKRDFYRVREAHGPGTRQWCSEGSTAWTVVYEADPLFQTSCLHRFIYLKGVRNVEAVLHGIEPIRGHVSTVGIAASDDRAKELATVLAAWGVTRICPLGEMQSPPLHWRHDGRPALRDLIVWTDWEP